MDFKAFRRVLKAEDETETFFDQLMNILREIDRIECLYSGYPVDSETKLQRQIQAWFDGLSDDQKADSVKVAQNQLSFLKEYRLQPLEVNSAILEAVLNQMKYEEDAKEWLRPAMSSLLNKSTQDLQTIQGALSNLDEKQFDTFLDNFHEMASRIAGQNRNRLTDTYEILMDKLAEHDGNADITVRLNAAYDEVAQKCQNFNPLQRGLSVLKSFLSRKPSLQNLPRTLVNPFASESPAAVSDAPTGGEASGDTVDGAAKQQSTPDSSQQHQNPLQKLGQRITSLPWIGRIKTGAFGIAAAAAAVITTHPLRQWIGHQRKGTLILGTAGGVTAAVAGIALVANAFRGNGGNGPSPAPTGAPTPSNLETLEAARDGVLKDVQNIIDWRENSENVGYVPGQGEYRSLKLKTLLNHQGDGGLASSNAQISGGTREELVKLAKAANVDPEKILTAYQTGYNNAYINAYASSANVTFEGNVTESVHAHAMTESLKAVKAVIAQEHNHQASLLGRFETLVGNLLPKGAPANAAEGPLAMVSSTPNPLATMMHGAVSRLEGVAHNVAIVAQHPAAQAAMKTLGVVGVVASVAKTVHEARSGNTALAVMNGAAAVATAAATVGMPPVAAIAGAARIGAYAADRSGAETLNRVTAQQQELTNKLATLKEPQSPRTFGNAFQMAATTVALATKTVDVLAAKTLNAARENVQSGVEATSQMLTQAQEVTGNAVASTKENLGNLQHRVAAFFTHRQTTAAL